MNDTRMQYADTAFDSRQHYDLPPRPTREEMTPEQRQVCQAPLPRGVRCGEFLALSKTGQFLVLQQDTAHSKRLRKEARQTPCRIELPSLLDPAFYIAFIQTGFAFLGVTGGIPGFIAILYLVSSRDNYSFSSYYVINATLILIVLPLTIFLVCKALLNSNIVKNKNQTYFDRASGMLSMVVAKQERVNTPFAQLDGYWHSSTSAAGSRHYHLYMESRIVYPGSGVGHPDFKNAPWKNALQWELMQAFMDISRPLPDIPEFELWRDLDPVTAAHDQRTGRDPHYWRNTSLEDFHELCRHAEKRAKDTLDTDALYSY